MLLLLLLWSPSTCCLPEAEPPAGPLTLTPTPLLLLMLLVLLVVLFLQELRR